MHWDKVRLKLTGLGLFDILERTICHQDVHGFIREDGCSCRADTPAMFVKLLMIPSCDDTAMTERHGPDSTHL